MKKLTFLFGLNLFFIVSLGITIQAAPEDCAFQEKNYTIKGNSLFPIIKHGEEVKIILAPGACFNFKRNDIVLFQHPYRAIPFIKIIKGLPGDKLALQQDPNGYLWNILINNEILKNSEGIPFAVTKKRWEKLHPIEGIIPEHHYFLMGNMQFGSQDSSLFGLIDESQMTGKMAENAFPKTHLTN